jgi:hypothetical protein
MKYYYKVLTFSSADDMEGILNYWGNLGWYIVSVNRGEVYAYKIFLEKKEGE